MSPYVPPVDITLILTGGLFVLGLLLGSFLNVVIARVPHGQSIVRPRSRCPRCHRQLTWHENIPLVSWAIQRGRCRGCGNPISIRYPAVELLTGLLFLACLARFGWTTPLVAALVLVVLLVPLTFIDLEHWILPFELTVPGICAGLGLALLHGLDVLIDSAIGAAVGFAAFWALEFIGQWIFKKEALGAGDKYLLALIGAFLGWQALLGVIFLSSLQGALIGSLLLLVRGRAGPAPDEDEGGVQPESRAGAGAAGEDDTSAEDDWVPGPTNIPFGPWLALAALEIMLLGPWLSSLLPEHLAMMLFGSALE